MSQKLAIQSLNFRHVALIRVIVEKRKPFHVLSHSQTVPSQINKTLVSTSNTEWIYIYQYKSVQVGTEGAQTDIQTSYTLFSPFQNLTLLTSSLKHVFRLLT